MKTTEQQYQEDCAAIGIKPMPPIEAAPVAEPKHTPGPWTLECVPTQSGSCWKIGKFPSVGGQENYACVYVNHRHVGEKSAVSDELEADARLIAAAPETARQRDELASKLVEREHAVGEMHKALEAYEEQAQSLEKQRDELLAACKGISLLGGNLPDSAYNERGGPNDARMRGQMYCDAREIARAAIARCQPAEKGDA